MMWRPTEGRRNAEKEGRFPGSLVRAVRYPVWNGRSGTRIAAVTKALVDERGGLVNAAMSTPSPARQNRLIPHHEIGHRMVW